MHDTVAPPSGAAISDLDIFTHENITNPLGWHAGLREPAPLVWLSKYDIWATGRFDEVHGILSDWKTFCSGAGVGLSNFRHEKPWRPPSLLLEADPPDHTGRRTVAGRIMSHANLRKLRTVFTREAAALVEKMLEKDEIDGVADIAKTYILKVFPDAIGLAPEGREDLLLYGDMIFNGFGPRNEIFDRSMVDAERVGEYVMRSCTREALAPDGLGAQAYEAADAGEISEHEALFIVRSFLGAGLDTTVDTIGNALNCFATHPAEWEKLRQEPTRARAAVEEVLRFDSPFQGLFRTTNGEVELGGMTIEGDQKIMVSPGAANRDPRKWDDPDTFNIDRDAAGHLGMGYGIHECVGQVIARLEMESLFAELAKRVARIEPNGEAPRRLNNTLHGFARLPLVLHAA